jgi:hypothetical protein
MGALSSLGPIDAQIVNNNKAFSADAFLKGLDKIKKEVIEKEMLNLAYIPILQNISPGEIQHCENAQNFSKILVTQWLSKYKFKYWDKHSKSGETVTEKEKTKRAEEIADVLCKQSQWLTHARSIKIKDFEEIGLKITDFSKNEKLNEAILRYYTLLRMSFDSTNLYKIFETVSSQIYRFVTAPVTKQEPKGNVNIDFECPKCKEHFLIQPNLEKNQKLRPNHYPFPVKDNIFKCPNCSTESNLSSLRLQVEAQTGKKIVE